MSTSSFGRRSLMFVVAALAVAGCSDSEFPIYPLTGLVYGVVTAGNDEPVAGAVVTLTSENIAVAARMTTDASGRYGLDVPPGSYRLQVDIEREPGRVRGWYTPAGLTGDASAAQILEVTGSLDGSVRKADMTLGTLHLVMSTPEELNGEHFRVEVVGIGGGSFWKPRVMAVDGRVDFTAVLRPDQYTVETYLPNFEPARVPGLVQIQAGRTRELGWDIPEPGFVRGEFTGSWQELAPEPPVIRLVDESGRTLSRSDVASDGAFELMLFHGAPVLIKTTVGRERLWDETGRPAGRPFVLESGDVISGVHIHEIGIAGNLVGPGGFRPMWGSVDLYRGNPDSLVARQTIDTPDAAFRFSGLMPGTYYLEARPPYSEQVSWDQRWYDGAGSFEDATPVVLDGSATVTEVDFFVPWAEEIPAR